MTTKTTRGPRQGLSLGGLALDEWKLGRIPQGVEK